MTVRHTCRLGQIPICVMLCCLDVPCAHKRTEEHDACGCPWSQYFLKNMIRSPPFVLPSLTPSKRLRLPCMEAAASPPGSLFGKPKKTSLPPSFCSLIPPDSLFGQTKKRTDPSGALPGASQHRPCPSPASARRSAAMAPHPRAIQLVSQLGSWKTKILGTFVISEACPRRTYSAMLVAIHQNRGLPSAAPFCVYVVSRPKHCRKTTPRARLRNCKSYKRS